MKTHKSWISRRSFLVKATQTALALTLGNTTLGNTTLGNWAKAQNTPPVAPVKWDSTLELALNITLERPSGGRYDRPYVAVWLEDASGNAVRTLELWMKQGRGGARYLEHLSRWTRDEQARQSKDGGDLAASIASPTREAGKYSLVWDGKNDKKLAVDQGTYYICVETAREHGPYQLIREAVVLGAKPLGKKFTGDSDLKEVSVEYRKRK
jgi:hypothetical protein